MKVIITTIAVVLIAAAAGGYWYYRTLDARVIRLTPETIASLKAQTEMQDESAVPQHKAGRVTQNFNPTRNAYFGDVHVHTSLSFDSYLFGNRNDLDDAYRFANGSDLTAETGERLSISRPLDFVAITDHAESFILHAGCASSDLTAKQKAACAEFDHPSVFLFRDLRAGGVKRPPERNTDLCETDAECRVFEDATWATVKAAADRYNVPGEFTTFIAYEYSPVLPETGKVHRNVIFRNSTVPDHAASAFDAATVLDLWRWLETSCTAPCEVLTIPHNMNKTWGLAYSGVTIDGDVYTADDWSLRDRSEPLAEIFQIKGASECAVGAGAVDEECSFEQALPLCEAGQTISCVGPNSLAREGLRKGLLLEQSLGFNPLQFGFVAATDTHNGNPGDAEEWDFRGANGVFASPAGRRLSAPEATFKSGITRSPGGLAGVWAEENTRDALFDAMLRRETFATSGTRIRLRFFAGWGTAPQPEAAPDAAYEWGVPMGGLLSRDNGSPTFLIQALADGFSAPLQKIQLVKGWLDGDVTRERVLDIACSDGHTPSAGRCPDNGARVDPSTCAYSADVGDTELRVVWRDPDFDSTQAAFYYVRVLENPTCRWSTWDALRLGAPARDDVALTIQERAWSSPIWYRP